VDFGKTKLLQQFNVVITDFVCVCKGGVKLEKTLDYLDVLS
jgi:2-keto-3-deoxy-6-phosphogluconate aldolase